MIYLGEFLNSKILSHLNKGLIIIGVLFGLAVGALGFGTIMEKGKASSMKEEIATKSKAIADAKELERLAKSKPVGEAFPKGLAAVGTFQNRLNKLAKDNACSVTQFQASDQMVPFISTFTTASQPNPTWVQVEVKMNLLGQTKAVVDTLRELDSLGIPYEFTSLEMSRTQANNIGVATITANVSLRVLTVQGGA